MFHDFKCIYFLILNSDTLFENLRNKLIERTRDKEAAVRVQAVISLSKFQVPEEGEDEVESLIANIMRSDPSADVRKAALANIEINQNTIPYVVERIRDVDARVRRYVFGHPMQAIGDCRVFSISDREQILSWGLNDRDASVQRACANMLSAYWIRQCNDNIIEFLTRLDVTTSTVAEKVLQTFFDRHAFIDVDFDENYWNNLTAETALFARVYIENAIEKQLTLDDREVIPEVSRHASRIQNYFNKLASGEENEEQVISMEYICVQLLKIACSLDFSDEAGRRNLFNLLRSILLTRNIVDTHIQHIAELMKKLSINERDYIRVFMEIASEILDQISSSTQNTPMAGGDEINELATDIKKLNIVNSNEKQKRLVAKSLSIISVMLQNSPRIKLAEFPFLTSFLQDQVLEAIVGEDETLQLVGLFCLVQYCLADKDLAVQNFSLIFNLSNEGNSDEVRSLTLRAIFDLALLYGLDAFETTDLPVQKMIHKLGSQIENFNDIKLQTIAAEGFSKILAIRPKIMNNVLAALVMVYFDPQSSSNDRLRQSLSFFFAAFCSKDNERKASMAKIFADAFLDLVELQEGEDVSSVISPLQIGLQFIEWIFPSDGTLENYDMILDMAMSMLKDVNGRPATHMKAVIQVLARFPLDLPVDLAKLEEYIEFIEDVVPNVRDKATLSLIEKLRTSSQELLTRSYTAEKQQVDEEEQQISNTEADDPDPASEEK